MLEDANREIRRLLHEEEERQREAGRLTSVVRAIDGLLFQLEELNLQGVDRVPAPLRDRAGAILEILPEQPHDPDFRVRFRVTPMIDVLFRAQEVIFQLRDPSRTDEEEEEDLPA